jgi:hypothetical protein
MGIRGVVTDARSGRPVFAAVKVHGLDHLTFTDPDAGDYHRMLLPGVYGVTFSAVGYGSHTEYGVSVATGQATRVNVSLDSEGYENRVTVPVSFPNQWVVAAVWDSSASDWSRVETLFAPERVQVPCPAANVWRWLGLWRPGGGSLAAGYWFVRSEP